MHYNKYCVNENHGLRLISGILMYIFLEILIVMSSTENTLKRKTLKLKNPNPLFEKWLQDWKDEAAARNSDTQYAFAKALQSLKKYPLPLKTGKECLILENFGTRICLLLDRKLADYKKAHPDGELVISDKEAHEPPLVSVEETQSPKPKKSKKNVDKYKSPNKRKGKLYTPAIRSAPYAVLVALLEHLKKSGPPGEMSKTELQNAAQPLCDTSMFKPLPGSYYSGWSCVGQLINKQLVIRTGNPHRFSLTEDGIKLAEKLSIINIDDPLNSPNNTLLKDSTEELHTIVPSCTQNLLEIFINDEKNNIPNNSRLKCASQNISRLSPSKASSVFLNINVKRKSPVKKSTKENRFAQINSGTDSASDNDYLTQESTSSQGLTQAEEIIFLPGSFETVLLIDTQEIHKGDELVKALEALGVKLEVRRLKVGDFAWISRNSMGQELLMPYIVERKRLDDLASSIKDGRFHEQKFRMKQSGVPHCMYLIESHGQRQYSLPITTLLQAAANTEFIDRFSVKYTSNSHETVTYLATFTSVITRKFANKTLLGCAKSELPQFNIQEDCVSLMSFKEFNKLSSKIRKYNVKEMFIKQLVQLRGLSVEKALAIVERYPCPRSLISAYDSGGNEKLLADVPAGNLRRKIGPVISKAVYDLYSKDVLR